MAYVRETLEASFLSVTLSGLGCNAPAQGMRTDPAAGDSGTPRDAGPLETGADAPSAETGTSEGGAVREFDLGLDFSFSSNPNGSWRYGYTRGSTLAIDQFLEDAFSIHGDPAAAAGFWHPSDAGGGYAPSANPDDGGGGYYPYVAENPASFTTTYQNAWALRSGEVAMEASNAGQFSVIEFVAPQGGVYLVQTHFEGIHFRLSTTDVHVRQNDVDLFASNIDGYGGDPVVHPVQGTNPVADHQAMVTLQAGDIITFAVGFGADKTNYNDTTGLFVHIALMSN
jgi:hypothetical protein